MNPVLLFMIFLLPLSASEDLLARYRANPRQKELYRPLLEQLIQDRELGRALEICREILKTDALNAYVMGKHSYLLLTAGGRIEDARKAAQRTLNYFRDNVDALHTLGWLHYLQKEYPASLRHFREIKTPDIRDFELQYHWALSAWKADQPEMARQHFDLALNLNPKDLPLLLSRSLFEESQGKPSTAIRIYQRALTLAPAEGPVREFILDKLKSMLPSYQKQEMQPASPVKDGGTARDRFSRLVDQYKSPEQPLPVRSIPVKRPLAQRPASQKTAPQTAPVSPADNPFLRPIHQNSLVRGVEEVETLAQEQYHQLGELMLERGLSQDAVAEFQTALSLNRNNPTAHSAKTLILQAEASPKTTDSNRIPLLFQLSEDLYRQNNRVFARYILQKILLLEPAHPKARKNLAYLYLEMNHPVSALPVLKQLTDDEPLYQEAWILYGYCLARLRRFREASDALNNALKGYGGRKFSDDYATSLRDSIHSYEKPLPLLD